MRLVINDAPLSALAAFGGTISYGLYSITLKVYKKSENKTKDGESFTIESTNLTRSGSNWSVHRLERIGWWSHSKGGNRTAGIQRRRYQWTGGARWPSAESETLSVSKNVGTIFTLWETTKGNQIFGFWHRRWRYLRHSNDLSRGRGDQIHWNNTGGKATKSIEIKLGKSACYYSRRTFRMTIFCHWSGYRKLWRRRTTTSF